MNHYNRSKNMISVIMSFIGIQTHRDFVSIKSSETSFGAKMDERDAPSDDELEPIARALVLTAAYYGCKEDYADRSSLGC